MSYRLCEEIRIRLEDKLLWLMDDGRYLRLSSARIGGLPLPVLRIAETERALGRRYRRSVRFCVHITTRYCARSGAATRNITVDVYYCQPVDELRARREFLQWLRRKRLLDLYLTPGVDDEWRRRRIVMFWRWWLREMQKRALRLLEDYLIRFFGAIHCVLAEHFSQRGEERREEYQMEREEREIVGPPIAVYVAAYFVYREIAYKVRGQYCRCDNTGRIDRCNNVPEWEFIVLE